MTTAAMVLGALPLAVGAGAESRHQIGLVVVGLPLGTFLTLFIVPTAYTLLARDRSKKKNTELDRAAQPHPAE